MDLGQVEMASRQRWQDPPQVDAVARSEDEFLEGPPCGAKDVSSVPLSLGGRRCGRRIRPEEVNEGFRVDEEGRDMMEVG